MIKEDPQRWPMGNIKVASVASKGATDSSRIQGSSFQMGAIHFQHSSVSEG